MRFKIYNIAGPVRVSSSERADRTAKNGDRLAADETLHVGVGGSCTLNTSVNIIALEVTGAAAANQPARIKYYRPPISNVTSLAGEYSAVAYDAKNVAVTAKVGKTTDAAPPRPAAAGARRRRRGPRGR